jgi:hypothetical protein
MRAFPTRGAPALVSDAAREVPAGAEFSWGAMPHARSCRVILLDESLGEIARLAPTVTTTFHIDAGALPPGLAHGRTTGWEVEAPAGGDRLAVSQTRAMHVP